MGSLEVDAAVAPQGRSGRRMDTLQHGKPTAPLPSPSRPHHSHRAAAWSLGEGRGLGKLAGSSIVIAVQLSGPPRLPTLLFARQ